MQVGDLIEYSPMGGLRAGTKCIGIVKEVHSHSGQVSVRVVWTISPWSNKESGWIRKTQCKILSKVA